MGMQKNVVVAKQETGIAASHAKFQKMKFMMQNGVTSNYFYLSIHKFAKLFELLSFNYHVLLLNSMPLFHTVCLKTVLCSYSNVGLPHLSIFDFLLEQ